MSNSDQPAIAHDQRKPPFQFSIAFLLWLTAACAFVLGIAVWTPCFFNPILAVGIVTIATIAYRKGKRTFWSSFVGCLILTSVSFVDWLIHVVRLPPCPITDPALGVFQILLFMNIGLGCGLGFSALISKYEDSNAGPIAEQRQAKVSQDE